MTHIDHQGATTAKAVPSAASKPLDTPAGDGGFLAFLAQTSHAPIQTAPAIAHPAKLGPMVAEAQGTISPPALLAPLPDSHATVITRSQDGDTQDQTEAQMVNLAITDPATPSDDGDQGAVDPLNFTAPPPAILQPSGYAKGNGTPHPSGTEPDKAGSTTPRPDTRAEQANTAAPNPSNAGQMSAQSNSFSTKTTVSALGPTAPGAASALPLSAIEQSAFHLAAPQSQVSPNASPASPKLPKANSDKPALSQTLTPNSVTEKTAPQPTTTASPSLTLSRVTPPTNAEQSPSKSGESLASPVTTPQNIPLPPALGPISIIQQVNIAVPQTAAPPTVQMSPASSTTPAAEAIPDLAATSFKPVTDPRSLAFTGTLSAYKAMDLQTSKAIAQTHFGQGPQPAMTKATAFPQPTPRAQATTLNTPTAVAQGDLATAKPAIIEKAVFTDAVPSTGQPTPSTAVPTITTTALQNPVPMPALAQHIRQHATPGKPTASELSLAPEELGKLRIFMTPDGDKLRIVIQAERPETLELLRRNSESFAADLRQSGFAGASFSFGGWGDQPPAQQAQNQDAASQPFGINGEIVTTSKPYERAPKTSGLDLRV